MFEIAILIYLILPNVKFLHLKIIIIITVCYYRYLDDDNNDNIPLGIPVLPDVYKTAPIYSFFDVLGFIISTSDKLLSGKFDEKFFNSEYFVIDVNSSPTSKNDNDNSFRETSRMFGRGRQTHRKRPLSS